MPIQRDALLDSIGLQSAMFLADRFARLLDLAIFFMLTHICHVRAKYVRQLVMLWYRKLIKSSVSSICERTVFVYHQKFIFLLPTVAAQRAKFVVRHVGIHMIIVNVFQIDIVLFEQDQKIRVVAYQMFRISYVRRILAYV